MPCHHHNNTRFLEVVGLLKEMGFQSTPKMSFGDGGQTQMFRKTVLGDRSGNAETLFAEFYCCSWHGQISTLCRTETVSARQIWRQYADVLEIWGTDTSDTFKCKQCNPKLSSLRHRQPV